MEYYNTVVPQVFNITFSYTGLSIQNVNVADAAANDVQRRIPRIFYTLNRNLPLGKQLRNTKHP